MKWIRRIFVALAILGCGLAGFVFSSALSSERPVGFQNVRGTGTEGQPFAIGVWYPTQARPWPMMLGPVLMYVAQDATISGRDLPLVVISHGNGGGPGGHADLALALANAGHVVAAPMHIGDNYADQSAVGSVSFFNERTRQLHATVDHMLKNWQGRGAINPERVGAFGFSAGGFTVLTAVGAQPDLSIVAKRCAETPEFVCDVLRAAKSPLLNAEAPKVSDAFLADSRIKAAVVAAPGLGFTIAPDGLSRVRAPIQLWSGDKDDKVPYATNAKLIREALGSRVEFHSVPGAGHFSFLVPCGVLRPPGMCADPDQFDRKAFHASMNASVVAFFERTLKYP